METISIGYPKKPLVQDGLAMIRYVHNRRPLTRAQEQRRKKREIRVTPSTLALDK